MSADNGLIITKVITKLNDFYRVIYYQGELVTNTWEFRTLREAIKKAQEIDEEYMTEYHVQLKL